MRAPTTFELPPAGADAAGLEGYAVESLHGEHLGTVRVVLRHEDETYVTVERGKPPAQNDLRAVPWERVDDVDHAALVVHIEPAAVASGLELDADQAVEDGDAEARRVTDLLARPQTAAPDEPGPIDRPSWYGALAFALTGLLATLGLVVFASTSDFTWEFVLFAVPAALLAAAAALGYRFLRRSSTRV